MSSPIRWFALLLLLLASGATFAQQEGKPKKINLKKALSEAREAVRVEEYDYALPILLEIDSLMPEEAEHHYLLGAIYLEKGQPALALQHLQRAQSPEADFPNLSFLLGRAYHLQHDLDSAQRHYQAHVDAGQFSDYPEAEARLYFRQCETGKALLADKKEVQVYNLGEVINSPYPDYAPVVSADETRLIFTSRRPGNVGGLDPVMGDYYEDIYIVEKNEEGIWLAPRNIGTHINTPTHDASIGLSPDGNELFVYRANSTANRLSGDIYYSDYDSGEWSVPVRMQDGINSRYWEPHASITANEEVLFFTSNREGEDAQGGRDIYMVRRLPDLTWALPVNLKAVNTPYDEDAPFIHPDGRTLYFSSNGPNSMGGFDIFISEYDEATDSWSEPKNMGYPINTAGDDIYVVWSTDGERGYFSSERGDSFGEKDLYMVIYPEKKLNPIVMKGVITDLLTGQPLPALVEVVDNHTQRVVNVANANPMTGKYAIILPPNKNYGVRFKLDGYLFKSFNINVPEQFDYLEIVQDGQMKPIDRNQYEVLSNVFFSEDMGLRYESDSELRDLKQFQASLPEGYVLEIMVHSDNSEDSLLSVFQTQAQADAIAVRLGALSGDSRSIIPTGAGSRFPSYSNSTARGRSLNRRVEYLLRRGQTDEDMLAQNEEVREAPKEQVYEAIVPPPPPVKKGDEIVIKEQIAFKTNSSVLETKSFTVLDELATFLLDHPTLVVEVAGHTDNQGTDAYNMALGERRASVVAQQLIFRGVPKEMLVTKSYGESRPIASNDTPEGRAKNRRTEFIVISSGEEEGLSLPVEQD